MNPFIRKRRGKAILAIAVFCIPVFSQLMAEGEGVIRLSDPVEATDSYEVFGASFPQTEHVVSLAELIENSDQYQGQEVTVETRIAKVCQKKGCFFVATEGAATARITFKNYGFFIPTDSGGKQATLVGMFSRKPVSKEEAEHYASDLGEEPEATPEAYEYAIVASTVKIQRS